ncbi:hypothetical protein RvY_11962 [Ramazzottius varieornatus]|uniref:Uncharacterized protein n=1 Tax=Ramazzottius varieornatus TaxID=947166 RepID=A0A1D1VRP3_RAMVA|nr:hypothetical protein RvY_11962 [Ramazzottius varieornatus]
MTLVAGRLLGTGAGLLKSGRGTRRLKLWYGRLSPESCVVELEGGDEGVRRDVPVIPHAFSSNRSRMNDAPSGCSLEGPEDQGRSLDVSEKSSSTLVVVEGLTLMGNDLLTSLSKHSAKESDAHLGMTHFLDTFSSNFARFDAPPDDVPNKTLAFLCFAQSLVLGVLHRETPLLQFQSLTTNNSGPLDIPEENLLLYGMLQRIGDKQSKQTLRKHQNIWSWRLVIAKQQAGVKCEQ